MPMALPTLCSLTPVLPFSCHPPCVDGVTSYQARIPASAFSSGDMVRWHAVVRQ